MKTIFWILIIFFSISFTTAFWLDYFAIQRQKIKKLEEEAKKMDQKICHQAREMNRLSKERNFWITETNRLREKIQ